MVAQVERFLQLRCVFPSLLETFSEAKVPFMRSPDASEKQIDKFKLFWGFEISFTMRKCKILELRTAL